MSITDMVTYREESLIHISNDIDSSLSIGCSLKSNDVTFDGDAVEHWTTVSTALEYWGDKVIHCTIKLTN